MNLKTKGVIIKVRTFSENDLLIDLFTLEKGKITVISKGAKNLKSKLSSSSNLFLYGEFEIYMGKKWNQLSSIQIINSFYSLREDIEKLAYGSYFLELIGVAILPNKRDKRNFVLLLKTLALLDTEKYILLKVAFEYKLMKNLGFQPQLQTCVNCSSELDGNSSFDIYSGGVLCSKCYNSHSLRVSTKLVSILRYIDQSEIDEILKIEINSVFVKKLDIILYKYIVYYLEKSDFKSLSFLNTLREV